jgi:hypothetical protein
LKPLLLAALATAFAGGIAAAATISLLPPVGASQTFVVSTHTDAPFHHPQPNPNASGAPAGPPPGGAQGPGGPAHGNGSFQEQLRDQNGTLTFNRSSNAALAVTASGDLDTLDSPLAVNAQGAIDPGQNPNRFIIAFDNASAIALAAAGTPAGTATFSALVPQGSLVTVPLTVKVLSTSGDTTKLEGTGSATITLSTPHGDRPVDMNATAELELTAGRLSAYTQTLEQTVKTPYRTMTITTTTSFKAQ